MQCVFEKEVTFSQIMNKNRMPPFHDCEEIVIFVIVMKNNKFKETWNMEYFEKVESSKQNRKEEFQLEKGNILNNKGKY